jgi:hypothetical protein
MIRCYFMGQECTFQNRPTQPSQDKSIYTAGCLIRGRNRIFIHKSLKDLHDCRACPRGFETVQSGQVRTMGHRQTRRLSVLAAGAVWIWIPASAQTQVNLRTQSKNVDFTGAPFTRPVKTGIALPAACGIGELFLLTSAAAGSNLYACVTANTWALEGGGDGGGGSGAVSVQLDGTLVGTRAIENLVNGTGVVTTAVDTGARINIQDTADTAVMLTRAAAQTGLLLLCPSSGGSPSAYTCSMSPTLAAYSAGMTIEWKPDVNGAGGPTTLSVDTLGARPVKLADGTTDPTPVDILAGRLLPLWHDGTVFHQIAQAPVAGAPGISQPTCNVSLRGRLWFATGAGGSKDSLTVCAKDATDAYAWQTLY